MRHSVVAVAAAAVFALAACGEDEPETVLEGDLDASAQAACDTFARYWADGHPEENRAEVIGEVADLAAESSLEEIQRTAETMMDAIDTDAESFERFAADYFAAACQDAGWEGANG